MRLPPRRLRRLLLPVEMAVLAVVGAVFGVLAVIGAAVAPFWRPRRLLRVATFGLAYCWGELVVLVAAGGLWLRRPRIGRWRLGTDSEWLASNEALLAATLGGVLAAAARCFGFRMVLADGPEPPALVRPEPVLVLARHGGPGDSFALVHLLLRRYRRGARVVLKDILQLDPALDVLLNRLGCCFLPAHSKEDLAGRLADLARDLGPDDALLVFPEGGNWTPGRRHRAIRRLRADNQAEAARAASLMAHVLPPRPAGVLACLDARPELRVVVVAHAGLDRIVGLRQAWDNLPLEVPMTVRAWAAAAVPEGDDARLAWLTTEWATIDEWIDAYHTGPGPGHG